MYFDSDDMAESSESRADPEQWFMTTQGATIHGIAPEGNEHHSWGFAVLLRDLIYGLPDGVNLHEWRQWVDKIYSIWGVRLHRT